jgi:hypothetical protein
MTTEIHGVRFTDHDWQLVTDYAARVNMAPQQWLVNVVIGERFRSWGETWQGIKARGNPTFGKPAQPGKRCRCDVFKGDGIDQCETCGLPLMERGE